MILLLCGVGFGICVLVFAVAVALWRLLRKGVAIIISMDGAVKWHVEGDSWKREGAYE